MQASGSWMIKTEIGRRRRFIIFNGGLEERQEPCQIVQMHNCSGQMMVERSPLSVIHERSNEDEARRKRRLSQKAEEENREATGQRQTREKRKPETRGKTKTGTTKKRETLEKQQSKFFGNARVLMLTQKLIGDGLKFLIGKASSCV